MQVDVLFVGDFRFPGGTSTSIASEARALAAAGYRLGLLSIATSPLSDIRPIHPEISALAENGLACFVPPRQSVTADLTLLHHPSAFERLPAVPPLVTSHRCLMIVHHPAVDAAGVAQYDVARVAALAEALFGPVMWAPVGPKVRTSLEQLVSPPPMTPEDWVNIIDPQDWMAAHQRPLPHARPVIGRHSRPDIAKWPDDRDTLLAAYPDAPDLAVRLLGYSEALDEIVGERPANWDVLPFGAMPARDFLQSLDYFSYFHGSRWIEAFGRSILEAMATGLVCLLPPHFEEVFGDGALYCTPEEVAGHVRRLERDPKARAALSERAQRTVADRYGPRVAVARVAALIGAPRPQGGPAGIVRPRVLYFTSNGVGMGHLTRCMASARRLSPAVEPVIVTMSKAFGAVRDEGMLVEYLCYFRALDIPHSVWTAKLSDELADILDYYAPEVFVFDGNLPYRGMLAALDLRPEMWRVWQRRPLWRPEAGAEYLELSREFDVVIEPGELAAPVDRGPTVEFRDGTMKVAPVRFLDEDEALTRPAARAILGLDPDRPALLMQLGAGNNFDFRSAAQMVFDLTEPLLGQRPDLQVVFARWRISQTALPLPPHVRLLDTFPISRHLKAFDLAVASAGYNTFHENIAAGLPTLFVANDHPEQDEQWLRADYAALRGLALAARSDDIHALRRGLETLLRPGTRARITAACSALVGPNGAAATARFLEGLALTRKASPLEFRVVDAEATR